MGAKRVAATVFVAMAIIVPVAPVSAQGDEPFVINNANKKIVGTAIAADSNGNIQLQLPGGSVKSTFRKGSYKHAYAPRPKIYESAVKLYRMKKFGEALAQLDKAFTDYRYLGWAGDIARYQAKCYAAQDNIKEAIRAVDSGLRYETIDETKTKLKLLKIEFHVAQKEMDKAERLLTTIGVRALTEDTAPFVFNTRGAVLRAKGKPKDAVKEYFKTIRLCPEAGEIRREAYENLIAIMQELNDVRHKTYAAEMKQQYQ